MANELGLRNVSFEVGNLDAVVDELRRSRLPSGWTPLELLKHLTYVELRWIEWGFQGRAVADPWGDQNGDRWHVAAHETRETLVQALRGQAARTRSVIESIDLVELANRVLAGVTPSPRRWSASCFTSSGSTPAT
jgi:hypothetical protein